MEALREKEGGLNRDLANGTDSSKGDKKLTASTRKQLETRLKATVQKIAKWETELTNLRRELERRLSAIKEQKEAEQAMQGMRSSAPWTEAQGLRLIDKVHSIGVQQAFSNHVDKNETVWADVGRELNEGRPDGHPERQVMGHETVQGSQSQIQGVCHRA